MITTLEWLEQFPISREITLAQIVTVLNLLLVTVVTILTSFGQSDQTDCTLVTRVSIPKYCKPSFYGSCDRCDHYSRMKLLDRVERILIAK